MLKAVFVLSVFVFLNTVKGQDGEEAITNVPGYDVDERQLLELYEKSELSKQRLNFIGHIITKREVPECCPYKKELVHNVQVGKEVCNVIFAATQDAYKTVCICRKCTELCNNEPLYGCYPSKWQSVKLAVCCPVSQSCQVIVIKVPIGPCQCSLPHLPQTPSKEYQIKE